MNFNNLFVMKIIMHLQRHCGKPDLILSMEFFNIYKIKQTIVKQKELWCDEIIKYSNVDAKIINYF